MSELGQVLTAIDGVGRRIGTLEKNVRFDVQALHMKFDETSKNGCTFGQLLEKDVTDLGEDLKDLKEAPKRSMNRIAALVGIIVGVISIVSFVVAVAAKRDSYVMASSMREMNNDSP